MRSAQLAWQHPAPKKMDMTTTCTLIRAAKPMGKYKATGIDAAKEKAAFRLIAVGKKNSIVWADGRPELVTDSKLAKLQSTHTWEADF